MPRLPGLHILPGYLTLPSRYLEAWTLKILASCRVWHFGSRFPHRAFSFFPIPFTPPALVNLAFIYPLGCRVRDCTRRRPLHVVSQARALALFNVGPSDSTSSSAKDRQVAIKPCSYAIRREGPDIYEIYCDSAPYSTTTQHHYHPLRQDLFDAATASSAPVDDTCYGRAPRPHLRTRVRTCTRTAPVPACAGRL